MTKDDISSTAPPAGVFIGITCHACKSTDLDMIGQHSPIVIDEKRVRFYFVFKCKFCHQHIGHYIESETVSLKKGMLITPN